MGVEAEHGLDPRLLKGQISLCGLTPPHLTLRSGKAGMEGGFGKCINYKIQVGQGTI